MEATSQAYEVPSYQPEDAAGNITNELMPQDVFTHERRQFI